MARHPTLVDIVRALSNIPFETSSEKLYTQLVKKKKNHRFIPLGSNSNISDHYDPISLLGSKKLNVKVKVNFFQIKVA